MKILTVIGARPQFIKAWPVSSALAEIGIDECLLHTGQHYDHSMSGVFFEELGMKKPAINLGVGSGSHGVQTARMLEGLEKALIREKPDTVLLYGDTNSTLAGALAAVKLHIPIAHVEAGLRSFNRKMPEEHNRILTDHCSDLLFCPTKTSVKNLSNEGIKSGVHLVGDVMRDALFSAIPIAKKRSSILERRKLKAKNYVLATLHRAENVDDPATLSEILDGFGRIKANIVLPLHPRTKFKMNCCKNLPKNLKIIEPIGYIDMVWLAQNAAAVMTDSGGLQKEAVWLGVPCVTIRNETEWVETLDRGGNFLAGTSSEKIADAFNQATEMTNTRSKTKFKLTNENSKKIASVLFAN